ncbi:hypothetical protein CVT25_009648 [Psilocybe cyanescens]|uniref:Uncharacterized protein n=1 Tax=Psilocybe cyanescens TaxID=93625 RepID=A0A409XGY1_PSICY|nr:hypothetical protein CVT25_009648 [Psilocybe cyanescens]
MSDTTNNLVFRNFLTSDIDATKALAFTPDIIPHFGNDLDKATLISEYDQFISLPLQPYETNHIYIRAATTSSVAPGARSAVVLRAVPSELILWPQAWNTKKALGPGPLVFNKLTPNDIVAHHIPFHFNPSSMGGFHYALIATQASIPSSFDPRGSDRLRDILPAPPSDVKNWREFLNFINNDTSTAYYNVVVADPRASVISVSTRLHVVDDGTSDLNFNIIIESSSMPDGTHVTLSSPSGIINMGKTPLSDNSDVGVHVSLPPGFNDTITIAVYPPSGVLIETFAWVSLQASVVVDSSSQSGGIPITNVYLLGAQNIVFHDDATTNLNFASPASNKLRKLLQLAGAGTPVKPVQDTLHIASTANVTGSATGWWFRDALNDTNNFPRTNTVYHSPDIQAVGDSPLSDPTATLGGANANKDYTDANSIVISQGKPNYTYVRGNSTLGNYDVEIHLFCIPNNLVLYPATYSKWAVNDVDEKGNPIIATRTIIASATSLNVLDNPFDILDPIELPSGNDHYCLVAETRHPTAENPDPNWPHEDTGSFDSSASFNNWVGSTPTVSQRNITFRAGGATEICTCIVTIPGVYPSSADWTLQVDADNAPLGSTWRLTGSGPAVPGVEIGFNQTTITASNMTAKNGMKFSFKLSTSTPPSGPRLLAKDLVKAGTSLPDEAANWPYTVGIHHPGVKASNSKGYLGRRFEDIGPNTWPYARKGRIGPTVLYTVGGDHWNFH